MLMYATTCGDFVRVTIICRCVPNTYKPTLSVFFYSHQSY